MANNKAFIAKNGLALGDTGSQPDVRPVVLFDFQNAKTLPKAIEFSRGTVAYCYDGKSSHLDSQNLFPNSAPSTWTASNVTVTADTVLAPNNATEGDSVTGNAGTSSKQIYRSGNPLPHALNTKTFSIYAKAGTHTRIQLATTFSAYGYVTFNLSAGTVHATSPASGQIVAVGNGWYRCSSTSTNTYNGSPAYRVYLVDSDSSTEGQASSSTGTVYLWGGQLEEYDPVTRPLPTPLIETTSRAYSDFTPTYADVAANIPRFHHNPATGESEGLLLEGEGTNIFNYSNLSTGSRYDEQYESTAAVGPKGELALLLYEQWNQSPSLPRVERSSSFTNTLTYTASCYFKSYGTPYARIYFFADNGVFGGDTVIVDLSDGSVTYNNRSLDVFVEEHGNGWWRIGAKNTAGATATGYIAFGGATSSTGTGGTGASNRAIGLWNAQLEQANYMSSPIETDTAANVTRSTDVCYCTDSEVVSVFERPAYTYFVSGRTRQYDMENANLSSLVNTSDAVDTRNGVSFRNIDPGDMLVDNFWDAGGSISNQFTGIAPYAKVVQRIENENFYIAVNGQGYPTTSNVAMYRRKNKIYFGAIYSGDTDAVTIERFAVYPSGISNAACLEMSQKEDV